MEGFYLDDRDPIFGIIIFIGIILLVAILSFLWGMFAKKDEKNRIENFINKFNEFHGIEPKYAEILESLNDIEIYGILAEIFVKSGDFEKAINVYTIALEKVKDKKMKEEILTKLGVIYFKAGFLQRANETLLGALELSPRNKKALQILSVIYERLRMYKPQIEVLDALQEQGIDTQKALAFTKTKLIQNDKNLSDDEKITQILTLDANLGCAKRIALEYAISKNMQISSQNLPNISDCIDILWYYNGHLSSDDDEIKAVIGAKNGTKTEAKSKFFEINAINSMKNTVFDKVDLSFKYICKSCHSDFPSHFYRCPVCFELGSVEIKPRIIEKKDEISQTF